MDEHARAAPEVMAKAQGQGLVTERLPDTIERDEYTPALLAMLNNMLIWSGSRVFHTLHGIGTNEWRVLSALGNWPGATASDLRDILGMNKSVASKSVNVLLELELIAQLDGPRGSRHLYLTDAGVKVHDDFMPVAMERQAILHESLTSEEVATLNSLLCRMLEANQSLQDYERRILARVTTASAGPPAAAE